MKFEIERKFLLDVLGVGGSMSGKSKVLPILDSCKVVLGGGRIIVSSYDGENAVLKACSVIKHDSDFSFCVNGADITKAVKSVRDAVLEFIINEDSHVLIIKHMKGFMELPYESADEFPVVDSVNDGMRLDIDSELLWSWLNKARNFAASDALRPILCGVNLYVHGNEYGVCASDSSCMFVDSAYMGGDVIGNVNAVIPNGAISAVMCAINGSDVTSVRINERNISFSTNESRVVCRRLEGNFPNFKAVLPKSHSVEVRLARTDLLDAVNRAKLFSNEGTCLCVLETMSGELGVTAQNLDMSKKSVESCVASISGNIRIGVKGSLLSQCLSVMEDESVVVEMNGASYPIIFRENGKDNQQILLMPLMLQN